MLECIIGGFESGVPRRKVQPCQFKGIAVSPRSWGSLGLWRTVQFGFLATFDKPQGFNKSLIDVVIRVQALVVGIVKEALQLIIGAGLDVPIAACTIARIVKVKKGAVEVPMPENPEALRRVADIWGLSWIWLRILQPTQSTNLD